MKRTSHLHWIALALLVSTLMGASSIYAVGPTDTISTVAGNGTYGYSGDGGPATDAQLMYPVAVAADAAGNLYIGDAESRGVRKVDPSGTISTVAGNGTFGYSGDGGPATAAQIGEVNDLILDPAGNLYISDTSNSVVRKVDPSGTISTVIGNGTYGYSGDGGPATAAQLTFPLGLALDGAGNLYIVDWPNHVVRKVDPSGTISTVAGNGTNGYSGDGGPATDAQLNGPQDVALDAAGNLYISDIDNAAVRKVDPSGMISTVAGNGTFGYSGDGGPATDAQLNGPKGLVLDAVGNLYIAETYSNIIRKVDASGTISTVSGDGTQGYSGDGGPAGNGQLVFPYDMTLDAAGNLYIADAGNSVVRRIAHSAAPADTTAPTIVLTTPPDGAVYTLDEAVNADYTCQDEAGGSGMASCIGPVASGSTIDTSAPGAHTFTVSAADSAGNLSTLTHSYSVVYNPAFGNNFGAPIDLAPTLNTMKAGGAVPVKFDLGGDRGLNILAAGYPNSRRVTCDTSAPIDQIEEMTTSNSGLTYDPTTGLYTYAWKTDKSWTNTCRQLTLRLSDGSDHIALFQFK